jgi:hypothetical protein
MLMESTINQLHGELYRREVHKEDNKVFYKREMQKEMRREIKKASIEN